MTPSLRRRALCTVVSVATLAGTALLAPASPAHAVVHPAKPYDFDGDDHPELVIAQPYVPVAGHKYSGEVVVIPGTTAGKGNAGAKVWTLDSTGVPGAAGSSSSGLGYSYASGDLNGDGYADLAIGAPNETQGGHLYVGAVVVLFGSASGLTSHGAVQLTPTTFGQANTKYTNFGSAVAIADFDHDGYADLAVGAPGKVAQYVATMRGSAAGLRRSTKRVFRQGHGGVPGKSRAPKYGAFGDQLATGDFNGDGRADLAIADPGDSQDRGYSTGAVTIINGASNATGTTTVGAKRFSLDTPGVPGSPTTFNPKKDSSDAFGIVIATGDLDGDGYADLVIGIPGHNEPGKLDAGAVLRMYGSKSGVTAKRSAFFTAKYSRGRTEAGEAYGSTVAIANVLDTRHPQVWVAAQVGNYVAQLASHGSKPRVITQNSPNIPDTTEPGDNFGACLKPIDLDGDGVDSLLVGAWGEDNDAGAAATLVSADLTKTGKPLSGILFEPGRHGLPGHHVAGGFGGNC
jgi:FG-GAP repeat